MKTEKKVFENELKWINSHEQFLINLQLEYLTHKLRSMIYDKETYAKVASDIAAKKRIKIQELGEKFCLDTIFTFGANVKEFVEKNFWQPYGLPRFQYKDREQRRVQSNYDRWYLLYRGTKVYFKGVEAEVVNNNPKREELEIKSVDGNFIVNYNDITLLNKYDWL